MCAVEGWLGANACRGHVIISAAMAGNILSQLALILQSPFCVGVGDGWGYCSSILHDCNIDIAGVIVILQSPVWCRGWGFVQEYV